jgi:hypothetical protein
MSLTKFIHGATQYDGSNHNERRNASQFGGGGSVTTPISLKVDAIVMALLAGTRLSELECMMPIRTYRLSSHDHISFLYSSISSNHTILIISMIHPKHPFTNELLYLLW